MRKTETLENFGIVVVSKTSESLLFGKASLAGPGSGDADFFKENL